MPTGEVGLVGTLTRMPIFHAEWVLWLLIGLSVASVSIMVERWFFYRKRRINLEAIRRHLVTLLQAGDLEAAASHLRQFDSLETRSALVGLSDYHKGPDAVEDLLAAAVRQQRKRYDHRLGFLATVGSNAPFIGLFGTVLGIIRAFKELAGNMSEASSLVMAGISEALIATAVGLLVAIPAVIAFNYFKSRVQEAVNNAQILHSVLLAQLKSVEEVDVCREAPRAARECA